MQRTLGSVLIAATLVVAACSTSASSSAPTSSATSSSVPTPSGSSTAQVQLVEDIDVGGGRTIHLFCQGTAPSGAPTIIGENGLTGDLGTWGDVYPLVAPRTRMCGYDRAGIKPSSDAPSASRTTTDQVDDLEALIAAAKLDGPFILVGHSIGAWNIALYASRHPEEVAGVVLVDPRGAHVSSEWLKALPAKVAGEPEALKANRDDLTTFETDPSFNPEHLLLRESAAQASAAVDAAEPLFGSRPLVLLSAANTEAGWSDLPPAVSEAFTKIWLDDQRALAGESTAGQFSEVPDTDHDLPFEQPNVVADAILQVLAAAAAG